MYYVGAGRTLHRVDLTINKDSVVRTFDQISSGPANFTISPDGRWLVYVRIDQSIADLMLIENFQ